MPPLKAPPNNQATTPSNDTENPHQDLSNTSSHAPPTSTHSMVTHSKRGIVQPNPRYALLVFVDIDLVEPSNFRQAHKQPEWRAVMCSEFDALQRNGTWSLALNLNMLSNKWVYKIKCRFDGSIEHFKACLVANGFHQQPSLDYNETFSPIVKHTTIHTVLALATSKRWSIRQLDVHNAFLHGYLLEEMYMRQPHGFEDPTFPHHVCRLHKSLYGLKQAPRPSFQRFLDYLEDLGFLASQTDPSHFTFHYNNIFVYLFIYVDDILITDNDASHISYLIQQLGSLFATKDLG